ncbi:hypothetical protein KKI95_08405 [Xenorhabdus bovienii]|uniref:hypothetical protein n=1 Tax=Xenorhabdus bovienii TaxID=40576 RepID=UPI0023B24B95|nr:hypothetical protein [Xenorhabdus bovienii]MDE9435955.1 hypothetical protein [Xenorhabdus bovienii]MDE9498047.1 hypothetical protein [Xenorhabdus bovienii]
MKFNLTPHQRNGEAATRWIWQLSGSSTVYQKIRSFRHAETTKFLLGETHSRVVVTDQCASYADREGKVKLLMRPLSRK